MAGNSNSLALLTSSLNSANLSNFSNSSTPGKSTLPCDKTTENRHVPCDVASFEVTDSTSGRTVKCTSKIDNALGTAEEFEFIPDGYDMLLETLADYEVVDGTPPKVEANIKLIANEIGKCPNSEHLKFNFMALDGFGKESDNIWITGPSPELKIKAPPSNLIKKGGFLKPFWDFSTRKRTFIAVVDTCGVRDTGTPVQNILAMVRVHPNDVYDLTLTIPAYGSFKGQRSKTIDTKGNVESTSSQVGKNIPLKDNVNSTSKTVTNSSGKNDYIENTNVTGNTTSTTMEGVKDGKFTISEVTKVSDGPKGIAGKNQTLTETREITEDSYKDELLSQETIEFKPNFSLKKNGQELKVTETLNDIINISTKIRDAWNNIQNWVPKVGWSATLEISILEGSISGKWGNYPKIISERLVLVEPLYELTVAVSVLKVKASIMVGIEFKVENWFSNKPLVYLCAKIEGTLLCEGKMEGVLTNKKDNDNKKEYLRGKAETKLSLLGKAEANLFGIIAKAEISLTGGVAFDSKLKMSTLKDPVVDSVFKMEKLLLLVILIHPQQREAYRTKSIILEEKTIWKGTFPNQDKKLTTTQTKKP